VLGGWRRAGWLAGVACPGQLGAVGLHPQAEGIQRRGIARVRLDQRHGLGHQLSGLLQVAAPQRQLGEAGEQRAAPLGLGGLAGEQFPGGLQPRLGAVEVAEAQLKGDRARGRARKAGPVGTVSRASRETRSASCQRPRATSASVALQARSGRP